MKKGGFIYYADTNQLKSLVDVDFDEALRTDDPEERLTYYKKFTDLGFKFSEELTRLASQNITLRKENEVMRVENQKNKDIIERLSKEKKKARHLSRLENWKKRNSNQIRRKRKH